MKTSDEILLFLVKNSIPEYFQLPVEEVDNLHSTPKKSRRQKLEELLLRISGTNRYICEENKLKEFIKENVSFEKHLRPLYEEGILYFNGVPSDGSFYDSKEYRKTFDHSTGRIKDYTTGVTYICFYYRENKFLEDYHNILKNAFDLKLL